MMEAKSHVENVVQYDLYPDRKFDYREESKTKAALEECREVYFSNLSPLLLDYIWQRDSFNLTPVVPVTEDCPPHLHGDVNFGDNVDDEWFIVYLLYQLTTAVPGLVVRIHDNDGEFLLIEAAYHLPKWLEPETSVNRVFIYQGDLHIIPKPNSPSELVTLPAGVPTISHALQTVRLNSQRTLADETIRKDVTNRINSFPAKLKTNFHHAHCHVPAKLAAILHHQPNLVAPAVEAFYLRDPIDLKACRVMKHFPPDDLVTTRVRFTHCLYAQLLRQRFQPDRRSGWKLPSTSSSKHKACDLGMKLAHGFEILCARCQGRRNGATPSEAATVDPKDVAHGARWERYLRSLKENAYFKGELEGSKLYRKLLVEAKKFYADTVVTNKEQMSSWQPGHHILNLMKTIPCDIQQLRDREKTLPPPDNDSWMDLTVEELDAMIAKASGKDTNISTASTTSKARPLSPQPDDDDDMDEELTFDPNRVTDTLKSFVGAVSGFEGVEFPGKEGAEGDVKFDAEEFERVMRNILDFREDDKMDSDSDSDLLSDRDYQSGGESDDEDDDDNFLDDQPGLEASEEEKEGIRDLMEQMDRELAMTEVGKSFERDLSVADKSKPPQSEMENPGQKDNQDIPHEINHPEEGEEGNAEDHDEDAYRPVEVDLNLLKNILESYSSQQGQAGPASNILHSMGIRIPMDADSS